MIDRIKASKVQLVVLDLDSTIWNGNADSFHDFVQLSDSSVRRRHDSRSLHLFPDVAPALQALHEAGVAIAIASASPAEATALRLLRAFKVFPFISAAVVKPGRKDAHLRTIHSALGLRSMQHTLFLDDLEHNLRTGRALGCTCVRVTGYCGRGCSVPCRQHGMTSNCLLDGLRAMQQTARSAGMLRSFFCPALIPSLDRPAAGLKRRIEEVAGGGGDSVGEGRGGTELRGEAGGKGIGDVTDNGDGGRDLVGSVVRRCPDRTGGSVVAVEDGRCKEEAESDNGMLPPMNEAVTGCGGNEGTGGAMGAGAHALKLEEGRRERAESEEGRGR
jgi:HAD superfamily phosphatase (TIGR01681 family)